jgi:DNA-binding transcriptional MerR regulator
MGGETEARMTDSIDRNRIWSIGELSREFGATPRALRFYEDKGLLSPARDGLNRHYSARDRARLQLILRGKRVGFSLIEIREMLDLYDLGDGQRAQMRRTLEKYLEQIELLKRQREDIEGAIAELQRGIAWINEQLARAPAPVAGANAYDAVARASLDGEAADTR